MVRVVVGDVDTEDRCSGGEGVGHNLFVHRKVFLTLIASHCSPSKLESAHEKTDITRKRTVSRQEVC